MADKIDAMAPNPAAQRESETGSQSDRVGASDALKTAPRRLPVVDGEINGDIYGYAVSARAAKWVAGRKFADPIASVYLQEEPFTLRDGSRCEAAWVAVTAN